MGNETEDMWRGGKQWRKETHLCAYSPPLVLIMMLRIEEKEMMVRVEERKKWEK